ncbi:DUF4394 domain-containing protein [Hymenobacter sp. BT523]|uniref:DUF4394 domain-containing protein n=1 Tax=Hymenobacter sp. BT523 TaxID=2795725 RepID=UPI0018EB14A5|nr:DUF4394 domain-containing protein [Hymenobacter sp. BT523]MBJ6108116.1 DUF4394 domain-containing protein [Hymenobacter sp. BT523]
MTTNLPALSALGRHLRYLGCAVLLLASAATARAQAPAQATTLYGLGTATQPIAPNSTLFFPAGAAVGDQGLITFFTANAGGNANPAAFPVKIAGVQGAQKLVGIDSRPLTGQLYALGYDATVAFDPTNAVKNTQLYTVNVSTGVVTPVGSGVSLDLGQPTNPLFVFNISFDFNPVADQIRVLSSNRNNYRISPVDGSLVATDTPLAYVGGTPATPGVVTAAYTNSTIGSTSTTLYDLDKANGNILTIQSPPGAGTLTRNTPTLIYNGFDNLTNSLALGLDIANNSTLGYLIQTTVANGSGISSTNLFDVNLQTGVVDNKRTVIPTAQSAGFNVFDLAVPIAAPVCDAPTAPASSGVTSTGATITFTPNTLATNYTVTVTPAGGTATTQTVTTSPVTLTGLTPNTTYTVSIVSNCFAGALSSSAVSTTFTTLAPACTAPSGLAASGVTNTSGTVTFTGSPSATSYTVTTAPATTTQTLPANATSVNFTGLTPSTTYTVSIVSNCAAGATAAPVTIDFTTAAPNPAPVITSLSPNSATAGGTGFTLTVTGTGFVSGAVVNFNGGARTTAFVSGTNLTASIPASDISTAGTYNVTVTNPAPGGGTSAPATFTVNNPAPAITSLSPASVTAGAAPQTLTVTGTNFVSGASQVTFNGTARTTTFVSATQLTIGLTAADQATPGTYNVTVTTAGPGGGTSAPATFTVNAAPCNAPSGLAASNVTSNSATVSFTGSGTATGYTVTTSPATTTQTLPAGATSVNFTGLNPSTAYTVSIVSNCAGGATSSAATVNFSTTAAPLTDLTVSTTQPVQGNYNNVIITSTGLANLTGPLTVAGTLTVQTGGTLVQNCQPITGTGSFVLQANANLVICDPAGIAATGATGAIQVSGTRTFSPDASYGYAGTAAQVTGPGLPSRVLNLAVQNAAGLTLSQAVSVTQRVVLQSGDLITNGQTLTLLSSAAGTAIVVNTGGVVNGAATVQRYIDPTRNAGLGYRHFSSPVQSSTVADLATSTFTPVVNPNYNTVGNTVVPFPTVFSYNETRVNTSGGAGSADFDKGFMSPPALNSLLIVSQGYTVNIGAGQVVDFVGVPFTGTLSVNGLTRGTQAQSGWHLRGNPYPSALDWNLVVNNGRLTNVDNTLYVFKSSGQYTGSYASYVNGQSTNGGTNLLPVAQGFFVRTSTAGASGSIRFTDAERVTNYDTTPFQRGTADTRPQLKLSLSNAAVATQAAVYFEAGATAGFDRAFDAYHLPAPNGLTLATEAGAEALAINGQPALTGADVLLPLQVASLTAGTYTLAVDNLANLPAGYHAYLRDALSGTYTDLAATPALSLSLAPNAAAGGRYAVLFTTQARVLATAPAALAQLASVYPNPAHGAATLLLPVALRGTQATPVSVVDNLGRTVLTRTLAPGTAETLELPVGGLAAGVYSVQARTAAGLVVKRLVVE